MSGDHICYEIEFLENLEKEKSLSQFVFLSLMGKEMKNNEEIVTHTCNHEI